MADGILILTGVAGAIIPRIGGWLRRTRVVKGGSGATAAAGTRRYPATTAPRARQAAPR